MMDEWAALACAFVAQKNPNARGVVEASGRQQRGVRRPESRPPGTGIAAAEAQHGTMLERKRRPCSASASEK